MTRERLTETLMGVAMILAPLAIVASYLLWPTMTSDSSRFVEETISLGRARLTAGLLIGALGIPLAIGAFLGVLRALGDEGKISGFLGAASVVTGVALFGGYTGAGVVLLEIAFAPLAEDAKVQLVDSVMINPGLLLPMLGGQLLLAFGSLILAIRMLRSSMRRGSGLSLGGFAVVYLAAWVVESFPLVLLAMTLLGLALVPLGLRMIRAPETGRYRRQMVHN